MNQEKVRELYQKYWDEVMSKTYGDCGFGEGEGIFLAGFEAAIKLLEEDE